MTTTLRQVLQQFEDSTQPRSLTQMARELDMPVSMLEGMIAYWVRKGKLREVGGAAACGTCSKAGSCHFVPQMPRTYELAHSDNSTDSPPPCHCCE